MTGLPGKWFPWAAATVLVVIAAAVWLGRGDSSLDRAREAGMIHVGYAVEAPYAFLSSHGEVTGESPEVARVIAGRLGIGRIEWRQAEFGVLIDELLSGRVDVIAAGMFITPERARRVAFSEPTFHVQPALLVPRGNPRGIHSYSQALATKDVRVAVLSGAIEESLLKGLGARESQLASVPDALTGRVAVESGYAAGLALSSPTIHWMELCDELGRTEAAQPFTAPEAYQTAGLGYGAFVFRKDDRALLAAWNRELKTFVGGPEHRALVSRFGFGEAELPGATTTEDILGR
ncbi:MAG TPA: transporter substrate-binding domain-containing protein [Desulfovibrio sp.]|jgi:polar amino acid transport system substrate-binding protein|uniref:transporter substrate-binding domain-containing protein n=1 Tax=Desulfovibrio TaxID=872 RepID=UPI0004016E17|nr:MULTISPECIES: transporter substrate-binding domain-containing protein [Desulfovibrio]MDY0305520.1 transporter substrate-binding domain-containing protein [Desulfovibrionaceae bacterium]HMM38768.1 transporter substrate-binding domain-containing protein [Desulfovibrio sp.]